jgi:hypothetical protein
MLGEHRQHGVDHGSLCLAPGLDVGRIERSKAAAADVTDVAALDDPVGRQSPSPMPTTLLPAPSAPPVPRILACREDSSTLQPDARPPPRPPALARRGLRLRTLRVGRRPRSVSSSVSMRRRPPQQDSRSAAHPRPAARVHAREHHNILDRQPSRCAGPESSAFHGVRHPPDCPVDGSPLAEGRPKAPNRTENLIGRTSGFRTPDFRYQHAGSFETHGFIQRRNRDVKDTEMSGPELEPGSGIVATRNLYWLISPADHGLTTLTSKL